MCFRVFVIEEELYLLKKIVFSFFLEGIKQNVQKYNM